MLISGLNKTTLLDYPGRVAATVFTGGCNFRCPFCHNGGLVLSPLTQEHYTEEDILGAGSKTGYERFSSTYVGGIDRKEAD